MELPVSLKIGPYRYTVDYGQPKNKKAVGVHRSKKSQIMVVESQSLDNQADTMLHEVLHGLMHVSGLNTTLEALDKGLEEDIIKTISPWLLQVIRDNPDLVEFLRNPE